MDRNGFTLIELLVVIAIIALLVSILAPTLEKAKELARAVLCASNLHHIAAAIHMYLADQDGMFPYNAVGSERESPEGWTSWWYRVGKVPQNQHDWVSERRHVTDPIWHNGYIDWRRGSYIDGSFKCPTLNRQVKPKLLYQDRWDNHYAMHGELIGEMTPGPHYTVTCYNVDDFRPDHYMVSDAHLGWNGSAFYCWTGVSGAYYPWPLQDITSPWGGGSPMDWPGHTGKRVNVARINGAVAPEREVTKEDGFAVPKFW